MGKRLSRDQLWVRAVGGTLELRNFGRRTLLVDGREVRSERCTVRDGDIAKVATDVAVEQGRNQRW